MPSSYFFYFLSQLGVLVEIGSRLSVVLKDADLGIIGEVVVVLVL